MGMYDILRIQCVKCEQPIMIQSKTGRCQLEIYDIHTVPESVLWGIKNNSVHQCTACDTWNEVKIGTKKASRTIIIPHFIGIIETQSSVVKHRPEPWITTILEAHKKITDSLDVVKTLETSQQSASTT